MRGWRLTLGGKKSQIAAYTDADWGSHPDDRRSVGAYVVKIGDGVVTWKSKKQSCVGLSSTEAENMAICQASKEAVWMVDFCGNFVVSVKDPMVVNADKQGRMAPAKNPVFHDRSKHIHIQNKITTPGISSRRRRRYDSTTFQRTTMVADLLTKTLPVLVMSIYHGVSVCLDVWCFSIEVSVCLVVSLFGPQCCSAVRCSGMCFLSIDVGIADSFSHDDWRLVYKPLSLMDFQTRFANPQPSL